MAPDISDLAKEFYSVIIVESTVLPYLSEEKTVHRAWRARFFRYQENLTLHLAQAIYDYTVLACAGEMRHAKGKARIDGFPIGGPRDAAVATAKNYMPESILKVSARAFTAFKWATSYGGEKWGRIASSGLMRAQLHNDIIWVDHMFDLAHNNGTYFSKKAPGRVRMGDAVEFHEYLRCRSRCSQGTILSRGYSRYLGDLLSTRPPVAIALVLTPAEAMLLVQPRITDAVEELLADPPVVWGGKVAALVRVVKAAGKASTNSVKAAGKASTNSVKAVANGEFASQYGESNAYPLFVPQYDSVVLSRSDAATLP